MIPKERAQGSTVPMTITLYRDGELIDLTGSTITMWIIDTQYWQGEDFDPAFARAYSTGDRGSVIKVSGGTVTPKNQTTDKGEATWSPTAADLDTPGDFFLQPWVVFADGTTDAPEAERLRVRPSIRSLTLLT